jgi:N-acetylmuramoyl-L-alanine amidase
VRLYRTGDQGEPIRDIQDRLAALGHECTPDSRGTFGEATLRAVQAFQSARGLPADGIVGPDTWRTLVGAGYRLGDRMLYHRVPMMQGDDVASLQQRLNALGFDSGKVDGIFGPDTLTALLDFQANRRMAEDGIAGRRVAEELSLMARATAKPGRDGVRDRQWLAQLPPTLVGQRIYVDAFCRTEEEAAATWRAAVLFARIIQDLGARPVMSRNVDTAPPERVRALRANRLGVDLIVSFAVPVTDAAGVCYFASAHSESEAGARVATAPADRLGIAVLGRSIPMLKDTRSPAVVIVTDPMTEHTGGRAAQGIIDVFSSPNDATAPAPRLSTDAHHGEPGSAHR